MSKKAKLVTISLMTRVIVDEDATDEQILDAAKSNFLDKINNNELMENLDEIVDDNECPYETFHKDFIEKFYQPQINDEGAIVGHEDVEIFSFEVWASKEELLKQFPNCIVNVYTFEDIEDPAFVDL